jgi:hypothetical protein
MITSEKNITFEEEIKMFQGAVPYRLFQFLPLGMKDL